MTKEEKIKEAWGENFPLEGVHENGYSKDSYWCENYDHDLYDQISTAHGFSKLRPKSLSGIENNNGWIKIENEDDLPKEGTVNHVFWNNEIIIVEMLEGHSKEKAFKEWNDKGFTHFRPIEKPKPPIY